MAEESFCDTDCCVCGLNPCVIPLNSSGYHKSCQHCITTLSPDQNIVCCFCQTSFSILPMVYNICQICLNPACKFRKCGHNSCLTFNNQCPECSLCTNCNQNLSSSGSTICLECISLQICPQCNKRATLYHLDCIHIGCYECFNSKNCSQCTQKSECCFCLVEKVDMFDCGHKGCRNCEKFCKECNYENACKNCSVKARQKQTLSCGHEGCELCYRGYCNKCESILLDGIYGKQYCTICPGKESVASWDCGHLACENCILYAGCRECEKKNSSVCQNCKKTYHTVKIFSCVHFGCENCFESGCKLCKRAESCIVCPNCSELSTPIQFICKHKGCKICYLSRPCMQCSSCIKCSNSIQNVFKEFDCKHRICLKCYEEWPICRLCNNQCEACKNIYKELALSECGHTICSSCLNNNKPCLICINTACICCRSHSEIDKTYMLCNHKICRECLLYGRKCPVCFTHSPSYKESEENYSENGIKNKTYVFAKSYRSVCEFCKSSEKQILLQECGHNACNKCSVNNMCKKCNNEHSFKICCTCSSNFGLNVLKCMHYQCDNCKLENYRCVLCGNQCNFCAEQSKEKLNFHCGHKGCSNCKKNNLCLKCSLKSVPKQNKKMECIECKTLSFKYAILLCNHALCNECCTSSYENLNYMCFNCVIQNVPKKCLKCYKLASFRFDGYYLISNEFFKLLSSMLTTL